MSASGTAVDKNGKATPLPATAPATGADALIAALAGLTAADLAELDQKIQAKRDEITALTSGKLAELSALLKARKLVAAQLGVAKPKAERKPRAAGPKPAGDGGGKGALAHERRVRIAKLLGTRGPLAPMIIARDCEIPSGSISSVLDCEWFERDHLKGVVRLTAVGRAESGI